MKIGKYFGTLKLIEWLASLRGIEDAAFFAVDDLLPFFVRLTSDILDVSKRIFIKLRDRCVAPQQKTDRGFGDVLPTRSEAKAA